MLIEFTLESLVMLAIVAAVALVLFLLVNRLFSKFIRKESGVWRCMLLLKI